MILKIIDLIFSGSVFIFIFWFMIFGGKIELNNPITKIKEFIRLNKKFRKRKKWRNYTDRFPIFHKCHELRQGEYEHYKEHQTLKNFEMQSNKIYKKLEIKWEGERKLRSKIPIGLSRE